MIARFAGLLAITAGLMAPMFPAAVAAATRHAGDTVREQATATAIDGSTMAYEIGTLYVPENRDTAGSRLIAVGYARVRALHPTGAPPVFLLAGGPGVTMLDIVLGRDDTSRRRVKAWQAYGDVADLVILEQRGYTLRGERMEIDTAQLPLDRPMTTAQDIAATRDLARRAQAAFPAADLSGYSIAALADDVDDLRRALGYEKVSLMAASFGSQWAFAYLKRHPGVVARAVIAATEPLDGGYDMPSQVFAAFERLAVEANRDAGLARYLPAGGLIAAIRATRDRFAKGPVTVSLEDESGHTRRVVLGLEDYQYALIANSANAADFPRFVLSAYHGHFDEWAREAIEWRAPGKQPLINPLINIGIDMSAAKKAQLRGDPELPVIGSWNFAAYLATKGEWPTPDAGDDLRKPVIDPTPVVFVHGDWDTSTPMDNTLEMQRYFPNSRTILVHRAQHNGAFALLRSRPAVASRVYDFLRDGRMENIPTEVSLDPVVFAQPSFSPPGNETGAAGARL
ncbi:MAG: alpha/beta hydrolase [Pseudomonadota bacterium]